MKAVVPVIGHLDEIRLDFRALVGVVSCSQGPRSRHGNYGGRPTIACFLILDLTAGFCVKPLLIPYHRVVFHLGAMQTIDKAHRATFERLQAAAIKIKGKKVPTEVSHPDPKLEATLQALGRSSSTKSHGLAGTVGTRSVRGSVF